MALVGRGKHGVDERRKAAPSEDTDTSPIPARTTSEFGVVMGMTEGDSDVIDIVKIFNGPAVKYGPPETTRAQR